MLVDTLKNLIESAGFAVFREIARKCLLERGFTQPNESDGWGDGGRDLRLYVLPGSNPK